MIDFDKLNFYCVKERLYFFEKYESFTYSVKGRRYIYIPGQDNVLAIAHLDYVGEPQKFPLTPNKDGTYCSIALDDRLGVYIILEILPQLNIFPSVLLTEDEEIGRSTASLFDSSKWYNWMFQFDRRGEDVVMYQYDTLANRALLSKHGFTVGVGSYSDICYLEHLGVSGYNFGTCYWQEHSKNCFMSPKKLMEQIYRFAAFYHSQKDTVHPYDGVFFDYYENPSEMDFCPYCGGVKNFENEIDDFACSCY